MKCRGLVGVNLKNASIENVHMVRSCFRSMKSLDSYGVCGRSSAKDFGCIVSNRIPTRT